MPAISGSKHHKAKLDDKKVRAIRKACNEAVANGGRQPLKMLAEKYNVSTAAVAAVASGRTWAHVSEA